MLQSIANPCRALTHRDYPRTGSHSPQHHVAVSLCTRGSFVSGVCIQQNCSSANPFCPFVHMKLTRHIGGQRPCLSSFPSSTVAAHKLNTSIARCAAEGHQDSAQFASNFRKYFTPKSRSNGAGCSRHASSTPVEGLASSSGKLVLGNDLSEESWRDLDSKVNKYPGQRTFTAIGTGGVEFESDMVAAVASVLGPIHSDFVSSRPSSKGAYVSVRIGPVWVTSAEQVISIYTTMKGNPRLKWYM